MLYPDGTVMRVGDLIWWNEGACVGYVMEIAESREEYESWGLKEPHAYFGCFHPRGWPPALAPEESLADVLVQERFFPISYRGGIGHNIGCFEDEGIGKLNDGEHALFQNLLLQAEASAPEPVSMLPFLVHTHADNCRYVSWDFTFLAGDDRQIVVTVPYPETC